MNSNKKSKAGLIVAIIVVAVLVVAGVFAVKTFTGKGEPKEKNGKDSVDRIESSVNHIKDSVESAESSVESTSEESAETPSEESTEASTEEGKQLDEIVNGMIPTLEEFEEVLNSIEFKNVRIADNAVKSSTMSLTYKQFDNVMSAELTFESAVETAKDSFEAKHVNDSKHYAYSLLQEYEVDGVRVVKVLLTLHNKNCEVVNNDAIEKERLVQTYILKGNTMLTYEYETNDANETNTTLKTFEKALGIMEYVTLENESIVTEESTEETTSEVASEESTESSENKEENTETGSESAPGAEESKESVESKHNKNN